MAEQTPGPVPQGALQTPRARRHTAAGSAARRSAPLRVLARLKPLDEAVEAAIEVGADGQSLQTRAPDVSRPLASIRESLLFFSTG